MITENMCLFDQLEVGDMVWAKMPLSEEELAKIPYSHRTRPYLVVAKVENAIYAYQASSHKRSCLNNYSNYGINQVKLGYDKNSWLNLYELYKVPAENLLNKMRHLNAHDLEMIAKRLTVLKNNGFKMEVAFNVPFKFSVGDVIQGKDEEDKENFYYVFESSGNRLICYVMSYVAKKWTKVSINAKNAYIDFSKQITLTDVSDVKIIDIANKYEIATIIQVKKSLKKSSKPKTKRFFSVGDLISVTTEGNKEILYYVYAVSEDKLFCYVLSYNNENWTKMYIALKDVYVDFSQQVELPITCEIEFLGRASKAEIAFVKKTKKMLSEVEEIAPNEEEIAPNEEVITIENTSESEFETDAISTEEINPEIVVKKKAKSYFGVGDLISAPDEKGQGVLYYVFAVSDNKLLCHFMSYNNESWTKVRVSRKEAYIDLNQEVELLNTAEIKFLGAARKSEISVVKQLKDTSKGENAAENQEQIAVEKSYMIGTVFETPKGRVMYLYESRGIHYGVNLQYYKVFTELQRINHIDDLRTIEVYGKSDVDDIVKFLYENYHYKQPPKELEWLYQKAE